MKGIAAALLWLCAPAAWGQGGFGGVRTGALYDAPAAAVRVVEGVAGAAHLGGAVLEGVGAAWVAPGGKAAVVRRGGVWALARGLGEDGIEEKELEQGVARARWSAGGRYVAVTGTDVIEVWDVEEMARVERVDLGEGREAASVAVSDAGEMTVAWFDGEATVAEAWRRGQWEEQGRVGGRGVVAVSSGRVALLGEQELVMIEDGREAWREAVEGRGSPVGVEIEGKEVVAAFGGEGAALVVWPSGGGMGKRVALETSPERLEWMGAGGLVLRLRERDGDEIWVAMKRDGEWRAYFVPAGDLK